MKKKKARKQRFSLKFYLIGLVILLVAVGFYSSRAGFIKVLDVPGSLTDYVPEQPVGINLIVAGRNLPDSDIPELNAMAAANVVIQTAVRNGRPQDDDVVQEAAKAAAIKAATTSYQNLAASGVIKTTTEAKTLINANVALEAERAVETINSRVSYTKDENVVGGLTTTFFPQITQVLSPGSGCSTSAGFQVASGETILGTVDKDTGLDNVFRCIDGVWEEQPCDYDKAFPTRCPVTVKPMYLTGGVNVNCNVGDVVIGNGSISVSEGKRCDNGSLVDVTQVNGQYLTPEDIALRKANCEQTVAGKQLGVWNDTAKICGAGPQNCENGGGVWNTATEKCDMEAGKASQFAACNSRSNYMWDTAKETCIPKPPPLTTTELALPAANRRYAGLEECRRAIIGTSTLECYSEFNGSTSGVYVRSKSAQTIDCPMPDGSTRKVDRSKGCGSISGSIAATSPTKPDITPVIVDCNMRGLKYNYLNNSCDKAITQTECRQQYPGWVWDYNDLGDGRILQGCHPPTYFASEDNNKNTELSVLKLLCKEGLTKYPNTDIDVYVSCDLDATEARSVVKYTFCSNGSFNTMGECIITAEPSNPSKSLQYELATNPFGPGNTINFNTYTSCQHYQNNFDYGGKCSFRWFWQGSSTFTPNTVILLPYGSEIVEENGKTILLIP